MRVLPSAIRSMADLQRLIVPGMPTNEVASKLGEPQRIENIDDGMIMWRYSLPAFPAARGMRGSYVIGVVIGISNGHVANWGCAYAGGANWQKKEELFSLGASEADQGDVKHLKRSPIVKLFVVSTDPVPNGSFIDTERFPNLGFIPPAPSLAIHKLIEVKLEERTVSEGANSNHTVWDFGIFLTKEDAARLQSVTTLNVSKKLLVMVGDEPVSAATIRAPLEDGSFVIECSERPLMEMLKRQLLAQH